MLWWALIIKRSLTVPPSHRLLHFCHSLLSQGWVSVGASCQQMVGSNPGKFANEGLSLLEPAGSSTSFLLAALFFTSQESSSGQNMCSIAAGLSRKAFFSSETQFYSVLLDRYTSRDEKNLQRSPVWLNKNALLFFSHCTEAVLFRFCRQAGYEHANACTDFIVIVSYH